jgi:hypothetical protein
MNDWLLTILLTILCYLVVDKLIVPIKLWQYLIIEFLLVGVRYFHMFARKKLFPESYRKPEGLL